MQSSENANLATTVQYSTSHSVYVPTKTKNFLKRPRLTRFLIQKMWWTSCWESGFVFHVIVWPFLMLTLSGEIDTEKWPSSKRFQGVHDCQHTECWKAVLLQGGRGINRECVFQPLSSRNCLAWKMWELQFYPEDLTSRVRVVYFPALFCTL